MKKTTLGHSALGFPPEGGQPKRHVALGLFPLRCSPSARWRFDVGTARLGPQLALGLAGQDPKQHWILAGSRLSATRPQEGRPSAAWRLLFLIGCTPSTTWRLGCLYFQYNCIKNIFFSIINVQSIHGKNIVVCFVDIIFFSIINIKRIIILFLNLFLQSN